MAFDPDKYLADTAPEQKTSFDPDAYLAETSSKESPQIGAGRAALVGAGQGATFGFGEELTAPVVAAAAMGHDAFSSPENQVTNTLPEERQGLLGTWDKYSRLMQAYRDTAREEQKQAQEQQPGMYTTGTVLGGALTAPLVPVPGAGVATSALAKGAVRAGANANAVRALALPTKAAISAGEGAGLGAAYGAGEGQGGLKERAQSAAEAAETGALFGAALPVAGQALSSTGKLASKVADIPGVSNTMKNFSRGLTKGENLITKEGRREASGVVSDMGGGLYQDIKSLQNQVGSEIQNKIDSASAAGEKVDLSQEVSTVLEKLKNIRENGSKDAASYASNVESEIKKILGIKPAKAVDELAGIEAPEGLILNKVTEEVPKEILVDPKKAQDLKQVLQDYSPKKGMTPQELEPARAAAEIKGSAAEKLNEVTGVNDVAEGATASLNQQYGGLKDALKMLKVNEKRLPEQIKQDITNTLSSLEKESLSGDKARSIVDNVLDKIEQVDPAIADKYRQPLNDAVERLQLASENKLRYRGPIGTIVHAVKPAANLAGLTLNKLGANKLIEPASAVAQKASNFANTVLNEQGGRTGSTLTEGTSSIQKMEPAQIQRQVASASENSDPETLKSQASQIRSQYGKNGDRLAMMLENMADKDKNARRALMFTILQDPNNRKMLGLTNGQE